MSISPNPPSIDGLLIIKFLNAGISTIFLYYSRVAFGGTTISGCFAKNVFTEGLKKTPNWKYGLGATFIDFS